MTTYDEVPYPGLALRQTHPDRLATVAHLLGVDTFDPEHCRVLEIGCSDAGNLLAMAELAPASSYVGIDLDTRAIDLARDRIERWGVGNVEVHALDLRDFAAEPGSFDVVIAHGVHSWVGVEAAEALMASIGHHLAPRGVAYVSYNTLPGSHLRTMVGDAVRRLVADVPAGQRADAARAWLDVLVSTEADGSHARILREIAVETRAKADQLLLHDDLAESSDPAYVTDFIAQAERVGLAYLSESDPAPRVPAWAADDVRRRLDGLAEPERQQLLDILTNRSFRQTLLVRADRAPHVRDNDPERLEPLWAATSLEESDADDGATTVRLLGAVTATTNDELLLEDLRRLGAAWPSSVAVGELRSSREALLRLYETRGVELRATPSPAVRPGGRPLVAPLARRQAEAGEPVATLRHDSVTTSDLAVLTTVMLCDGEHDRSQIAASVVAAGLVPASDAVVHDLDRLLDQLADISLFLA